MFEFDQYLGFLAFLTILTIGFWLFFVLLLFVIPYWVFGALKERIEELIQERKEYISSKGVTSNQLDNYLNEIPQEWERIQATIYQDEMDNSLDDKPLILQADSWRRFREDSFLIPSSLRSVDQSARGEIITLPFED